MIVAVSLNPSIDRALYFDSFGIGLTNRVARTREDLSGKGINVALTARGMGAETVCLGFMRERQAADFDEHLGATGVASDFLTLPGSVRVNQKLVDTTSGVVTEINQSGEPVADSDVAAMLEIFDSYCHRGGCVVLSGSVPPGCPPDIYKNMAGRALSRGCRVAVDADRQLLRLAIEAAPTLIKPNVSELEELIGKKLDSTGTIVSAAREIIARAGVKNVLVSMGAEGAIIVNSEFALHSPAAATKVVSTVGAGDNMLAGFMSALDRGESIETSFRVACACAAVSVSREGTQPVSHESVDQIIGHIRVDKL